MGRQFTQEVYEDYRIGGSIAKVKWLELTLTERKKCEEQGFPQEWFFSFASPEKWSINSCIEERMGPKKWGVDELQLKKPPRFMIWETVLTDSLRSGLFSRYVPVAKWPMEDSRRKIENKCWRMWARAQWVTWDGKSGSRVAFDKDAK